MSIQFRRNEKTTKDIITMFENGQLIVDESYQRKKVWTHQDNVRFIETIIMEMVIPEVFFWAAEIDPDTGKTLTHIVDGQQRIGALTDFVNGRFVLSKRYLLNESMKETIGDCGFVDLPKEMKRVLWQYPVPVVELDREYGRKEIAEIFRRLNLTEYSLNPQERRHTDQGNSFGRKSESLAENAFWEKYGVFSASDQKRMKDVQYCCSIYILKVDGIIDQTDNTAIQRFYDDNSSLFDEKDRHTNGIIRSMGMIDKLSGEDTNRFISKKAQMYTLFSLTFYLQDYDIELDEEMCNRFKYFVMAYDLFKNEFEIQDVDEGVREAFDAIKRYKLASSEGVNKGTNRTIRFNVLKDLFINQKSVTANKELIQLFSEMELERKIQV